MVELDEFVLLFDKMGIKGDAAAAPPPPPLPHTQHTSSVAAAAVAAVANPQKQQQQSSGLNALIRAFAVTRVCDVLIRFTQSVASAAAAYDGFRAYRCVDTSMDKRYAATRGYSKYGNAKCSSGADFKRRLEAAVREHNEAEKAAAALRILKMEEEEKKKQALLLAAAEEKVRQQRRVVTEEEEDGSRQHMYAEEEHAWKALQSDFDVSKPSASLALLKAKEEKAVGENGVVTAPSSLLTKVREESKAAEQKAESERKEGEGASEAKSLH